MLQVGTTGIEEEEEEEEEEGRRRRRRKKKKKKKKKNSMIGQILKEIKLHSYTSDVILESPNIYLICADLY
jgi:hypothetical protein